MSCSVRIKRSAQKELRALPTLKLRRAIAQRIASLAEDPRPAGCAKLSGAEKYRIRHDNYRILYTIDDHEIVVFIVRVAHRQAAYRP